MRGLFGGVSLFDDLLYDIACAIGLDSVNNEDLREVLWLSSFLETGGDPI